MFIPQGTRLKHFNSATDVNDWLEKNEANVTVSDIQIVYAPAFNWNREEYSWGGTIYIVFYQPTE